MALGSEHLSAKLRREFEEANRSWVGRRKRIALGREFDAAMRELRETGVRPANAAAEDRRRAQTLLGLPRSHGGSAVPFVSGSDGSVSWASVMEPQSTPSQIARVDQLGGGRVAFLRTNSFGDQTDTIVATDITIMMWKTACEGWRGDRPVQLGSFLREVNDVLAGRETGGSFALVQCGVIDGKSQTVTLSHAGWPDVHLYRAATGSVKTYDLPLVPPIALPPFLFPPDTKFRSHRLRLAPGDIIIPLDEGDVANGRGGDDGIAGSSRICTDESQVPIKPDTVDWQSDRNLEPASDPNTKQHTQVREYLGYGRILAIIHAVVQSGTFQLTRFRDPVPGELLVFDFSGIDPTIGNVVHAIYALELVFRLRLDPTAGAEDTITVPEDVAMLLEHTFSGWDRFFGGRIESVAAQNPIPGYRTYSHIRSDLERDRSLLALQYGG